MDDLAEDDPHNCWPGQEMTERMSDPADLKKDKLTNRIARIADNTVVPRAEEPDPHVPFIVSGSFPQGIASTLSRPWANHEQWRN
jgi:hypothetical protein